MDDVADGRRMGQYVGMWAIADLVAQAEFSDEVAKELLQKMDAAYELLPKPNPLFYWLWMAIQDAANRKVCQSP